MSPDLNLSEAARLKLAAFGPRYIWWDVSHSTARLVAQIMNLGTYDDVLVLEQLLSHDALVEVMRGSEAGWFSDRSWEFWNGRLQAGLAKRPPARIFARAS